MAGIVRYGSYVPYFRLSRAAIGAGKGERAVASYDEDTVSMAVEAAGTSTISAPPPALTVILSMTACFRATARSDDVG